MNQELKQYVETTIIPKYEMFDKAHNRTHVCTVIAESLILANGEKLRELRSLINNREELRNVFNKIFEEETNLQI